jgi:hypothetical protein
MIEQRTKADKAIVKACAEIYQKYESDVSAKCQNQQCDHSVFAELHMGFKKAGLLAKEFNHNIPPDVSISMVARDITKLFNKTATIVQYCNSGSGFHSECHNYTSMSDEAKKVEDILESFNPLRLASFGKSAVEEPTTTWGSVLANGGN